MAQPKIVPHDQFDLVQQFITTNAHLQPRLSVLSPTSKGTYEFTSRGDATEAVRKAKDGNKNLGMHLGGIVDVDIDVKPTEGMTTFEASMAMQDFSAAKFALARFLPAGVTFGTEKRPASHMFYAYAGSANELNVIKVAGKARIELRTGEGAHTVMAGSQHPTDGMYHFEPNVDVYSTIPSLDASQLNNGVSLANVFIDVYKEWESPNRNAVCMGLAGTFWYSAQAAATTENDEDMTPSPATLENLVAMVEAVMEYNGDTDQTRVRSIKSTWAKALKDVAIKSLKQDFPDLHTAVMEALRVDASSREYMAVRDQFAMIGDSKDVVDLSQERANGDFLMVPFDVYLHNNGHKYVNGKTLVATRLRQDPMTTRCTNVVTKPVPLKEGVKLLNRPVSVSNFVEVVKRETFGHDGVAQTQENVYFNSYAGPPFHPWAEPVTYEDVEDGIWFIKESLAAGASSNDHEHRAHLLLAFLADIVQDPAHIPSVAVVLTGIGGTGKTAYTDIAQALLRPALCSPTMSLEDFLDEKGGADLRGKLLVCVPESSTYSMYAGARTSIENKLKTLITEGLVRIRSMRQDPTSEQNYARVILNSNHPSHPVPIDANATRRYLVLTPSEEWSEKVAGSRSTAVQARWKKTYDWLAVQDNKRKLLRFFGDYEYVKESLRGPHRTEELQRLTMANLDTVDKWLFWAVTESGHPAPMALDGASDWATTLKGHEFFNFKDGEKNLRPNNVDTSEWPNRISLDALYAAYTGWLNHFSRTDRGLANAKRHSKAELVNKLKTALVDDEPLCGPSPTSVALFVGEKRSPIKRSMFADKVAVAKYLAAKDPSSDSLKAIIEGVESDATPTEY
jgi:hypothetical protein